MSHQIRVIGPRDRGTPMRKGEDLVMTVSKGGKWAGLSPFVIGPCVIPGYGKARLMENAWQFAKVYREYADVQGNPTDEYYDWAISGWQDSYAHRYPVGKGRKPLYALWKGKHLDYVAARKQIYLPLYREAVRQTDSYKALVRLAQTGKKIALWDYDGYDHDALGLTLWEVLNNTERKMGHAFVLKMMLVHGSRFTLGDLRDSHKFND